MRELRKEVRKEPILIGGVRSEGKQTEVHSLAV
jgi:hypothetical protein